MSRDLDQFLARWLKQFVAHHHGFRWLALTPLIITTLTLSKFSLR